MSDEKTLHDYRSKPTIILKVAFNSSFLGGGEEVFSLGGELDAFVQGGAAGAEKLFENEGKPVQTRPPGRGGGGAVWCSKACGGQAEGARGARCL